MRSLFVVVATLTVFLAIVASVFAEDVLVQGHETRDLIFDEATFGNSLTVKDFGTANLLAGNADVVSVTDKGTLNMYGGHTQSILQVDSGVANLYGGIVYGIDGGMYLTGTGIVNLRGASVPDGMIFSGYGQFNMYSGSIQHIIAYIDPTVRILGGKIGSIDYSGEKSLYIGGNATIDTIQVYAPSLTLFVGGTMNSVNLEGGGVFNGGTIEKRLTLGGATYDFSGGRFRGVIAVYGDSTLNFYGKNLKLSSATTGELDGFTGDFYHISGTLIDGSPIESPVFLRSDFNSTINLIAAPEPSVVILMLIGSLTAATSHLMQKFIKRIRLAREMCTFSALKTIVSTFH